MFLVQWRDAARGCEEWTPLAEVQQPTNLTVYSCGFLVYEDTACLKLVLSLDGDQALHEIVIPQSMVVWRWKLHGSYLPAGGSTPNFPSNST